MKPHEDPRKPLNTIIENDRQLIRTFGFIANLILSLWDNSKNILGNTNTKKFFNKTNKLAYHNLCTRLTSLTGPLLGLGMKFCIKSMRPNKTSLSTAFDRMRKDIRLRYLFAGEDNNNFNPRLYIKSEWEPEDASNNIEQRIGKFEQVLTSTRHDILSNTYHSTNLSIQEHYLLKLLTRHPDFVVVNSDKNLGPAIIEQEEYVRYMLKEHICNGVTYTQLTETETQSKLVTTAEKIEQLVLFEHASDVLKNEIEYFKQGIRLRYHIPQRYGSAKIHKM